MQDYDITTIADKLSGVPEVEYVLAKKQKGVISVWTVINGWSPAARNRVYQSEQAVIDNMPGYDFDFHLIERTGREIGAIKDIIPEASPIFIRLEHR